MEIQEYTEMVGERIQEWIDKNLTFENGCKREWQEDDCFEQYEVSWIFTQKGQRLYDSYINKIKRLIDKKFPNELKEDLENYTGVIYP